MMRQTARGIGVTQELGGSRFFLRVLFALVAVNLLTVGFMSLTAYDFNRSTVAKHAKDNIVQQVDILADRFDESYRQSIDRALRGLVNARSLDEYLLGSEAERLVLRRKIEREYLRLLADYPAFHAVRFIDSQGVLAIGVEGGKRAISETTLESLAKDGGPSLRNALQLLHRVMEKPLLLSSGNMEWFMPSREVELFGPFKSAGGIVSAIAALPKLDTDTRQLGGVVMIEVRFHQWFHELRQLRYFEQNPIWVTDPHQKLLLRPPEGSVSFDPTTFLDRDFRGQTAIVDVEPGFSAYRDLGLVPGLPFVRVAVALPHGVLVQDFRPAIRFFSLVLFASIGLLMAVSYVISRYLAKPVVALQMARNHLANAQRIAKLGHWSLDPENKEVQLSDHAMIILDVDGKRARMGLENFLNSVHELDRSKLRQTIEDVLSGLGGTSVEHRLVDTTGDVRFVHQEIEFDHSHHPRLHGTIQDISSRKNAEERIRLLAYYDAVTGLANRTLMIESLKQALEVAAENKWLVAVIFLDLDHFKKVNDTLGHDVGDVLLRQVGDRLRRCLRLTDTVSSTSVGEWAHKSVARLGGDEFVILLNELHSREEAALVAKRIKQALTQRFVLEGNEVHVSSSMGISLYPKHGEDVDLLLKHADAAMYYSKDKGRDRFTFYNESINRDIQRRLSIENRLHRAIEQEEFELYYQPRMSLPDGELVAVEALIRWQDPEDGMVLPDQFIKVAEETGLIVTIGEWALYQACTQLKQWQREFEDPRSISVNLSPIQISSPEFRDRLKQTLKGLNILPGCLELELTENALVSNVDESVKLANELRDMGVQLSIDDFGTGYSSLQLLKQFPLDTLKIDRSFIRDVLVDKDDAMIVQTAIALGRNLGLKIVAEGVETEGQLEFLMQYCCDEVQGYLFGKPQPASKVGMLFERRASTATG